MTTIKEILKKFDTNIELDENIQNYTLNQYGIDIDEIKEYHEETRDGEKIHVFRGTFNKENPTNFEIIINKQDKETGTTTITYLAYADDKYEEATSYNQVSFNDDETATTTSM